MSSERASVAAGRAGARDRRAPAPSRGHGDPAASRATANGGARPGGVRGKARLALAALLLLAGVLLIGAGALRAGGASGRSAAPSAAPTVDPRLVLVPRTVTQTATAAGVTMELTAGPLLPGANRFALLLAAQGRPLAGAQVVLTARMEGMAMPPETLSLREVALGAYAAAGPLPMFGQWQLDIQVERAGVAPLTHEFAVGVDLPPGLLAAPGARHARQQ